MISDVLLKKWFCYTAVNKVVFVACENNINTRGRIFSEMSWFCNPLIESKLFTKFGYFTGCIVTVGKHTPCKLPFLGASNKNYCHLFKRLIVFFGASVQHRNQMSKKSLAKNVTHHMVNENLSY